jgi:hypothetical protein
MSEFRTGVAYFGNRTLRHVRADLEDIAGSGFDYVVHCFSESDLLDGMETMREIVRMTRELDMEAHIDPWGVAGIFGGEAFSKFVAWEMAECQTLADGSSIGIACLHSAKLREFLHAWADAAIDLGADVLFWDEPHWFPGDLWFYGKPRGEDSVRWSCRCHRCQERFAARFGYPMPIEFTDDVIAFRQDAVLDLLADVIGYSANRGVGQTLCLLPHGQYHKLVNLPDWRPFAQIPGIDTFGTDPYWAVNPPLEMEPYVSRGASESRAICDEFGLKSRFWIQGYNFVAGHEGEAARAIEIAIEHGHTDLAVWSYRGCEAMSRLWPADIETTWETIVNALSEAKSGAGAGPAGHHHESVN